MNNGHRILGSALVPAVQVSLRALGLGGYSSLASTIQTLEGWYPGSLSYRLNNPGNLMYAGQAGAVPYPVVGSDGKTRVYAQFPDYATGEAALERQISLDASRGLSISSFAQKYAPLEDGNDPTSYAAHLATAAGLPVSAPLSAAADSGDTSAASFLGGSSWAPLSDLFPQSSNGGADPALIAAGAVILGLGILAVV